MDSPERFNQVIRYLEETLDQPLDYGRIGSICLCPQGLFPRLFPYLTGMTLNEYVRLRRLTRAAGELQVSNTKVIDLALRYGWESADAFTAAFRRFHHVTPTAVRRGASYRFFPVLRFSMMIQGGPHMNITIQRKPAFQIAGLNQHSTADSNFSTLWDRLFREHPMQRLVQLGCGQSYGACHHMLEDGSFDYLAGFDVHDAKAAQAMGLEVLSVPAAEYAVVELTGPVPDCIRQGWKYVTGELLPQHGYRHAGSPDFEVYSEGDMQDADYRMQLWVPLEKA